MVIKLGSTIGGGAATALTLTPLTSDPSLSTGKVWFRSDLKQIRYSPDGINVFSLGATGGVSLPVYQSYAGSAIFWGNTAAKTTTATAYAKVKEITLSSIPQSTLRIYFGLNSGDPTVWVYAQIYRNGVAVGTERSTQSSASVYFTEDISGWSNGALLQLFAYTTNATYYARVISFNILYLSSPNPEISNTMV